MLMRGHLTDSRSVRWPRTWCRRTDASSTAMGYTRHILQLHEVEDERRPVSPVSCPGTLRDHLSRRGGEGCPPTTTRQPPHSPALLRLFIRPGRKLDHLIPAHQTWPHTHPCQCTAHPRPPP